MQHKSALKNISRFYSEALNQNFLQRRWTAVHCFNLKVMTRGDWTALFSVCLPVHLVLLSVRQLVPPGLDGEGHSSHLGTVVQTRHSIHSDPQREGGHRQFTQRRESICSLLELTLNTADTPASHWRGRNKWCWGRRGKGVWWKEFYLRWKPARTTSIHVFSVSVLFM